MPGVFHGSGGGGGDPAVGGPDLRAAVCVAGAVGFHGHRAAAGDQQRLGEPGAKTPAIAGSGAECGDLRGSAGAVLAGDAAAASGERHPAGKSGALGERGRVADGAAAGVGESDAGCGGSGFFGRSGEVAGDLAPPDVAPAADPENPPRSGSGVRLRAFTPAVASRIGLVIPKWKRRGEAVANAIPKP